MQAGTPAEAARRCGCPNLLGAGGCNRIPLIPHPLIPHRPRCSNSNGAGASGATSGVSANPVAALPGAGVAAIVSQIQSSLAAAGQLPLVLGGGAATGSG